MMLRLLRASLSRRLRQVLLIAVAVLVASAMVSTLSAFSARTRAGLAVDLSAFGPNLVVRPQVGGPTHLSWRDGGRIEALDGVSLVAGVAEVPQGAQLEIAGPAGSHTAEALLWAADPSLLALHPSWRLEGRWPGAGEAVLGADLAQEESITLAPALTVVGTLTTGGPWDHGVLVSPTSLPPEIGVSRLEVRAVRDRLGEIAGAAEAGIPGAEARPVLRVSLSEEALSRRVTYLLLAVSAVALALALLSVAAATTALLDERRREVGLFLALGFSGRRVGAIFAVELLTVAALAAFLGELAGEAAAAELAARVLAGAAEVVGSASLSWAGIAGAMAVAVLTVGAAVVVTLRRVERLEPARVLRGE
jgi:putative ABC transport system permease protein